MGPDIGKTRAELLNMLVSADIIYLQTFLELCAYIYIYMYIYIYL